MTNDSNVQKDRSMVLQKNMIAEHFKRLYRE